MSSELLDDLTAFLRVRYDDDEKLTKAAAEAQTATGRGAEWNPGIPMDMISEHIAHHDPARVLREVAAKRRILYDHAPQAKGYRTACSRCHYGNSLGANWPCLTMASLAAVWPDHPDYKQEWAL